jgi:hypothetical protein
VRLKRALADPSLPRIDYVTLGSSRPEYGIDHAAVAAAARRRGAVHADLSMPGTHWMTVGVLTRWLARAHPEIRGGAVALSVADMAWPGNGSYELGIVAPFRRPSDTPWILAHVPLQRGDVASWGAVSALFGWRADVADFVRHPFARRRAIRWYDAHRPPRSMLFEDATSTGDLCAVGVEHLPRCEDLDAATDPARESLRRQCRELRDQAANRIDFQAALAGRALPDPLRSAREQVQAQLRATPWPEPPLVVLMPMPRLWEADVLGHGQHDWALAVLQPLADAGRIHLLDATGFFDADPDGGCGAFFDFYHQNAQGRDRFTQWLLPQFEALLYGGAGPAAPPGAGAPP